MPSPCVNPRQEVILVVLWSFLRQVQYRIEVLFPENFGRCKKRAGSKFCVEPHWMIHTTTTFHQFNSIEINSINGKDEEDGQEATQHQGGEEGAGGEGGSACGSASYPCGGGEAFGAEAEQGSWHQATRHIQDHRGY